MAVRLARASAPGRCGILGNPSDIYGGKVLSCSIPARAVCEMSFAENLGKPEDTRLLDAALRRFPLGEPLKVRFSSDVPRSSGLSGSTALLAAILLCVLKLRGESADLTDLGAKKRFAELVRDIERNEAGIMCGYQDAYMIVLGGLELMDFAGKDPTHPGPLAAVTPIKSSLPFLLVSTGVERLSGSVHGPMVDRYLSGEPAVVDAINQISRLAEPGAAALEEGRLDDLGEAMNLNQKLIAGIGGSGEPVDLLVQRCLEAGALGAKLAGAGMGGTVIALTKQPDGLQAALEINGYSRFMRPSLEPGARIEPA